MNVCLTDIGIDYHGARILESSGEWYLADKDDAKFINIDGMMRINFLPFEGNA